MMIEAAKELDDDDDDLEYWISYYLLRLQSELRFYFYVPDTLAILRSPMATISTLEASINLLRYSMPWNWDERYEKGWRKDQLKVQKRLEDMLPIYKHLQTLGHADDNIAFFQWGS